MSRRKPWGVWAATRSERSTEATTRPSATRLTVSTTGRAGTAAAAPASMAATTRKKTSGGVSARAASWTSTTSTSAQSASRPAATDAWRVSPPTTTVTRSRRSPAVAATSVSASPSRPAGATTTTCASGASNTPRRAWWRIERSSMPTKAFGPPAARRVPEPAATTMTARRGTGAMLTPVTLPGRDDCDGQDARTSSRITLARSSSVFSARASSEIRICFALASIRFSPADRPRS